MEVTALIKKEHVKASAEAAKELNPIKSDTFRVVSYRYHKIELEL